MRRLLVLLCLGCVAADSTPVPDLHLERVVGAMRFGQVAPYHWEDCGEVNAYYSPRDRTITLCNELRGEDPGFVRFVLAHETAHAIIDQLDVPYTGSEEVAADELAAVVLGVYSWSDDVMATALWYHAIEDEWVPPWDPHPTHGQRAFTLGCLARESVGKYPVFCDENAWERAVRSWLRLLDP